MDLLDRQDKNGNYINLGDLLFNSRNFGTYEVVFADDILAFGIVDRDGNFDFMSEWIEDEWEIIGEVV